MPKPPSVDISHLSIPPESALLRAAYERSGLSVGSMAKATGMSTTAIQIAMNGYRYRDGKATVTMPPDSTVVKMASVLRVAPAALHEAGRGRAAELLDEAVSSVLKTTTSTDQSAMAMSAGRQALAHQVLAAFSTEELRVEVQRRDTADSDDDEQTYAELADDLKAMQYPG